MSNVVCATFDLQYDVRLIFSVAFRLRAEGRQLSLVPPTDDKNGELDFREGKHTHTP